MVFVVVRKIVTECHENIMFHVKGKSDGCESDLRFVQMGGVVCKEILVFFIYVSISLN